MPIKEACWLLYSSLPPLETKRSIARLNAAIRLHIPASVHSSNIESAAKYTRSSIILFVFFFRLLFCFFALELPLLGDVSSTDF